MGKQLGGQNLIQMEAEQLIILQNFLFRRNSEKKEKELSDLGLIPIYHIKGGFSPVFHSNKSVRNLVSKTEKENVIANIKGTSNLR
jgi:hypothetical protein